MTLCATDAAHFLRTRDFIVYSEGDGWRVGRAFKTSEELIAQAEREKRLMGSAPMTAEAQQIVRRTRCPRGESLPPTTPEGERLAILRGVRAAIADLKRILDLLER